MSADIEKLAVLDSRIVQQRPKYAVEKGALSLTNAPFKAIAATASQMTFNIYVPSENVFVDRKIQWSAGVYQTFNVRKLATSGAGVPATSAWLEGDVLCRPGIDVALCAFPLNSLAATMSATINDTTTVINSQDVLKEVLRLTDYKKNRLVRTAPTMLDKYASYTVCPNATNNPIGAYDDSTDYDNVQNGAYPQLYFTNASGQVTTAYTTTGGSTISFNASGQPYISTLNVADATAALPVYVYWTSTEPIVLSPFVFSDHCEWETGLFGINNVQLICNLLPSQQLRNFRNCPLPGMTNAANSTGVEGRQMVPGSLAYNPSVQNVFSDATLNVQFLTPSLSVPQIGACAA
jgi:hypothetical protein